MDKVLFIVTEITRALDDTRGLMSVITITAWDPYSYDTLESCLENLDIFSISEKRRKNTSKEKRKRSHSKGQKITTMHSERFDDQSVHFRIYINIFCKIRQISGKISQNSTWVGDISSKISQISNKIGQISSKTLILNVDLNVEVHSLTAKTPSVEREV